MATIGIGSPGEHHPHDVHDIAAKASMKGFISVSIGNGAIRRQGGWAQFTIDTSRQGGCQSVAFL